MSSSQHFAHRPPSPTTLLHDPWLPEPRSRRASQTVVVSRHRSLPAPHRSRTSYPTAADKVGRWAFNLASEHLFVLGWNAKERGWAAYRTPDERLRFLPQ